MQTKVLIVAVIEKDGAVLLRKKPEGSPPYKETWYIFGAEFQPGENVGKTLRAHVLRQAGIDVRIRQTIGWDEEIKNDLDGVQKHFIYLDVICDYTSGELILVDGIEKLEWVQRERLAEYDNVPPSLKLFKKLGYIEE